MLLVVLVPLWCFGIWREHQVEVHGREVPGRVVGGENLDTRRPRFTIEFPVAGGLHRKDFSVTREDVAQFRANPEMTMVLRVHDPDPEVARLARETPLPWWGGVVGMVLMVTALGFVMWLKDTRRR